MTDPQAGVEDVPPGYKRTDVGAIPEDWSVSLLDSVAVRGSGHTPDKKHPEYWDGSIPWISLADSPELDNGYIYETTSTITPAGIQNSSAVIHPPETVVLTRDAGVGKSAIMGQAMAVSQHFMAWRCGPDINNHFLYYWLQSKKGEFERIAIGNTIKTIGLPYFKNLKIPLPHIHEQCAIAAALSDVDGLIGALDALIEKKRAIKQAAMQQLLTGKTRLPGFEGKWSEKSLGELASITMGQSPPSKYYNLHGDGLPLIQGNADLIERHTIARVWTTWAAKHCNAGDLLLTVRAPVGSVGIATQDSCLGRGVCGLKPLGDTAFLFQALINSEAQWRILEQGSTFTSANSKQIEQFRLICPEDEGEQHAIAAVLSDMDAEIAALERRREKAEQIKQGMMQQLLTGRIRLVEPPGTAA
jgi:type I restriction enzyme S subunit